MILPTTYYCSIRKYENYLYLEFLQAFFSYYSNCHDITAVVFAMKLKQTLPNVDVLFGRDIDQGLIIAGRKAI